MFEFWCPCRACSDDRPVDEQDQLTVSVGRPAPGVVVVRAAGDVDVLTAPCWERELRAAVELLTPASAPDGDVATGSSTSGRAPELVCDLDAVGLFGGVAISVLVAADEAARAAGCCWWWSPPAVRPGGCWT